MQNAGQNKREPRSFLGLPLKVIDRYSSKEKVIGVLKIEDIQRSEQHPEPLFTDQDVQLVKMMANVIATVVYNTQLGRAQMAKLSGDLGDLSTALAGGREMQDLVAQVVDTMARGVLRAEASSLYLLDKATGKLVIQAATGYQLGLVARRATYDVGVGVTGWIAEKGELFRANSLKELHEHPAWRGMQNPGQGGHEPHCFLGLPLKVLDRHPKEGDAREEVIGVLKIEDIQPWDKHPEPYFTDQDVQLVTMMANVIATVIYHTRWGEARMGRILKEMGMLSSPRDAVLKLLQDAAQSGDSGIIDQLAEAIALALDAAPERAEAEARALFDSKANPALYDRIAVWAKAELVRWIFGLFYNAMTTGARCENWDEVMNSARPWLQLRKASSAPKEFADVAQALAMRLAEATEVDCLEHGKDASGIWYGAVLDTVRVFGDQIKRLPLIFQRQGRLDDGNFARLLAFAQKGLKQDLRTLLLVRWNAELAPEEAQIIQRSKPRTMEIVIAGAADFMRLLSSPNPAEFLRSLVLRQVLTSSPFVLVNAVPDAMFFGRSDQLRQIIEYIEAARSCAVIGGRRIGKTSILLQLHRARLPELGFRTLYFDCSTVQSHGDFLKTSIKDPKLWRPGPPAGYETFEDLLRSVPDDKPFVLLLDEADKLVPEDRANGWPIFNGLRTLALPDRAQVVLSGERVLREAMADSSGPLFNFTNEVLIDRLDRMAVDELVTKPMRLLELELQPEAQILDTIYDFTSGHPNVVQRLCRRLIGRIRERRTRCITLEDVQAVLESPDFIRSDFLETYFAQASVLEGLCALFMAQDAGLRTLTTVHGGLVEQRLPATLNQVDGALERLVDLRTILTRTEEGYDFAVTAFPRIIAKSRRVPDWIALRKEIFLAAGDIAPEKAPPDLQGRLW
jgi:hypothetical protein